MNNFYEFQSFRVDEEKRLLWKGEEIVSIKPKTFDTLLALIKNKNEIISKDRLIEEIWQGAAVSDDSLTQQISQLRRLLGDSAEEHKFIITIPGVGYKFVAEVGKSTRNGHPDDFINSFQGSPAAEIDSKGDLDKGFSFPASNPKKVADRRTYYWSKPVVLLSSAAALILAASLFFLSGISKQSKIPENTLEVKRIAVLPFNVAPDNEQMNLLKQGLNGDLITRLSKIERLNILPVSSVADYGQSDKDPIRFGKKLNVEAVLDGRIQLVENSVNLTAQLIRVSDGKVLWSEVFDDQFTEPVETQRLIAYKISETLALELVDSIERGKMKRFTTSSEAYRLYLDAKYIVYSRKGGEARELARKNLYTAIQLDPNFALAYTLLALMESTEPTREAYQRMKVLATKALELDENLREAHVYYGMAVWRGDWNWTEAEKHFEKANRLEPKSTDINLLYALVLIGQGKFGEARQHIASRPVKTAVPVPDELALYYYERNYDKTIELCLDRLSRHPGDNDALSYLALAYAEKELEAKATEAAEQYASFDEIVGVGALVYQGYVYAKFGQKDRARKIIEKIISKKPPLSAQIHGGLAMIFAELGENDKAFEQIEKSIDNREWWAFTLKVAPYYDDLRADSRFNEMLARVNLK